MLSSKEVASAKAVIGTELAQLSHSLEVDAQPEAKYSQLFQLFPEEI